MRDYSPLDQFCLGFDHMIRAIAGCPKMTERPSPADQVTEGPALSEKERQRSAALMRVNHAGEVSAQALYQAQGLVSRDHAIKLKMQTAALEEGDHLAWCRQRALELGSHTSYLGPFWYLGSFVIGCIAGFVGDRWSLGFLAETEQQVVKHLAGHLENISPEDHRSLAILKQMQKDEAEHRDSALTAGAATLPTFVKHGMAFLSKIMVKTAYWV